jgi:hypothetical protein
MAAPKWGIFMAKVYADKKLGYGKMKAFEKPATFSNEELSADADWSRIFKQGDSTSVDEGNPDAGDFIDEPMINETPQQVIPDQQTKNATDTNSTKPVNKPEEKTAPKAVQPPAVRPLTETEKKLMKKDKDKKSNEY